MCGIVGNAMGEGLRVDIEERLALIRFKPLARISAPT